MNQPIAVQTKLPLWCVFSGYVLNFVLLLISLASENETL